MQLLDQYFEIQKQIYEHFGYTEDWVVIPLDDAREYFWQCDGHTVRFAKTVEELESNGDYYENEVYTQRFLSKWVYEADDYTMICSDTRTDGNKFLQVFDNAKRYEKVAT
tara:strand:+ start:253 stop:582 length:330 start_codon:yes stop_codon:yes gene_type:complete